MQWVLNILVGLLPVFLFLATLVFLDSYKLVSLASIVRTLAVGCCMALIAVLVNVAILEQFASSVPYIRYGAPIVEESLKASYVLYLFQRKRIGFMVDAAIYGFAVGAGFACVENISYMQSLENSTPIVWVVRGFGTALMHGGTTAIFGIIAKNASDRKQSAGFVAFLPALGVAMVLHSFYNHFFLAPVLYTIVIVAFLPLAMVLIFRRSEEATRRWLGVGFDSDVDLLNMILTGNFTETPIGKYLHSLKSQFAPEIVADMLCLLRIYTELAIRAKGILLARESGLEVSVDAEVKEKLNEMRYLRKTVGPTGLLALAPFLRVTNRDLWQINLLEAS